MPELHFDNDAWDDFVKVTGELSSFTELGKSTTFCEHLAWYGTKRVQECPEWWCAEPEWLSVTTGLAYLIGTLTLWIRYRQHITLYLTFLLIAEVSVAIGTMLYHWNFYNVAIDAAAGQMDYFAMLATISILIVGTFPMKWVVICTSLFTLDGNSVSVAGYVVNLPYVSDIFFAVGYTTISVGLWVRCVQEARIRRSSVLKAHILAAFMLFWVVIGSILQLVVENSCEDWDPDTHMLLIWTHPTWHICSAVSMYLATMTVFYLVTPHSRVEHWQWVVWWWAPPPKQQSLLGTERLSVGMSIRRRQVV